MRVRNCIVLLMLVCIAGCSQDSELVGVWKATSTNIGDGVPPEAVQKFMEKNAPAFDLNSDKSARVFSGGITCDGHWSVRDEIVHVECPDDYIKLEINGNTLITLPDRSFIFERQ